MIKLERGPKPEFWTRERVKKWTKAWLEKRDLQKKQQLKKNDKKEDKNTDWRWPSRNKKPLNQHAREAMVEWHYGKCAFCERPLTMPDAKEKELKGAGDIEHFRPKSQYPLAAFVWRNLFLCCKECNQAKGEESHEGCLKPDRDDPKDYLWINPISGQIQPRPDISTEAQQRARNTIKTYGLDRVELKSQYNLMLSLWPLHDKKQQNLHLLLPKLETLAQPHQPFSLFIQSLVKYLNQNQT